MCSSYEGSGGRSVTGAVFFWHSLICPSWCLMTDQCVRNLRQYEVSRSPWETLLTSTVSQLCLLRIHWETPLKLLLWTWTMLTNQNKLWHKFPCQKTLKECWGNADLIFGRAWMRKEHPPVQKIRQIWVYFWLYLFLQNVVNSEFWIKKVRIMKCKPRIPRKEVRIAKCKFRILDKKSQNCEMLTTNS